MLEIHVTTHEDHAVCRPEGEIDAFTVARLKARVGELSDHPRLVIDLNDVSFIDSAGVGAMVSIVRAAREQHGAVAVASGRPAIGRLLHTVGFQRLVPVRETVEEALAALDE